MKKIFISIMILLIAIVSVAQKRVMDSIVFNQGGLVYKVITYQDSVKINDKMYYSFKSPFTNPGDLITMNYMHNLIALSCPNSNTDYLGTSATLGGHFTPAWKSFPAFEPPITTGTSKQYWRGDKTWQTFPVIPAAYDTTTNPWTYTSMGKTIQRRTGNVGIGTTNPYTKLDVRGNARISLLDTNKTAGAYSAFGVNGIIMPSVANTDFHAIDVDPIYISSPTGYYPFRHTYGIKIRDQFTMYYGDAGTSTVGIAVQEQDSGHASNNRINLLLGNGFTGLETSPPTGTYSFYSQSPRASYFAGKLGIGITNPGCKLDVNGTIRGTGFQLGAYTLTMTANATLPDPGTSLWETVYLHDYVRPVPAGLTQKGVVIGDPESYDSSLMVANWRDASDVWHTGGGSFTGGLKVQGNITNYGIITTTGGTSTNWNSAYSTIKDGTAGYVLTSNGTGNLATFQPASGGGSADSLWKTVASGAYANASTFTFNGTAYDAKRCVFSLFQALNSPGSVGRYGYIKSASFAGSTVTATVVSTSSLAFGDKNFKIAYGEKIEGLTNQYRWVNTVPGVIIQDASIYQGMYYLNTPDTMYFVSTIPSVMTAASGSGAAATYNLYDNTTAIYGTSPDMGTNTVLADQVPATFYKISPGRNVTMRWLTSAGATTKCSDSQIKITWIPSSIIRAK